MAIVANDPPRTLNAAQIAQILAYTVCAFLLIYLLCYAFMKRRY